jgi:hypothetical protein
VPGELLAPAQVQGEAGKDKEDMPDKGKGWETAPRDEQAAILDHFKAVEALREATAAVHKVIGSACRTAKLLAGNWWTVAVEGMTVAPPGDPTAAPLSLLDWPGREEIARVLSAWHAARARLDTAWLSLPEEIRPLITQMAPPAPIKA